MRNRSLWAACLVVALALQTLVFAPPAAASQDSQRVDAVTQAIGALESYAAANGTYTITGGGGGGQGWYQYTDNATYQTSIAQVLINQGHLPTNYLTDPADPNRNHHLRVGNDFLIYRCKDRIAVFAKPDTTTLTPTTTDQTWWNNNNCIQYPITTLGHTYYQVSAAINQDTARAAAVDQAIGALESYAAANGTYTITGGGGGGQGWYQYTDNATYQTSIAQVLINQGHLPTNYLTDPADPNRNHHLRVGNDFLIYRCKDRIAVFAKPDTTTLTPTTTDQTWWNNNNCIQYPITTLGHTYYQVSAAINQDTARAAAVDQAIGALESYAAANGTYTITGGGGGGQGWYQYTDNATYQTSIAQVLINQGHLPTNYLTDPADPNRNHHLRVGNDFLIYRCKDRIAVFAKPDTTTLTPTTTDQTWWNNNNCIQYPITTLGHTYYQLSDTVASQLPPPQWIDGVDAELHVDRVGRYEFTVSWGVLTSPTSYLEIVIRDGHGGIDYATGYGSNGTYTISSFGGFALDPAASYSVEVTPVNDAGQGARLGISPIKVPSTTVADQHSMAAASPYQAAQASDTGARIDQAYGFIPGTRHAHLRSILVVNIDDDDQIVFELLSNFDSDGELLTQNTIQSNCSDTDGTTTHTVTPNRTPDRTDPQTDAVENKVQCDIHGVSTDRRFLKTYLAIPEVMGTEIVKEDTDPVIVDFDLQITHEIEVMNGGFCWRRTAQPVRGAQIESRPAQCYEAQFTG